MSELTKVSTQSLIPCTNRDEIITNDKQAFNRFLKVYHSIGGNVDEINSFLIKQSIEKNRVKIHQLETALMDLYESGDYVNWGNVLKRTQSNVIDGGTF
jgi:hypothetical protein